MNLLWFHFSMVCISSNKRFPSVSNYSDNHYIREKDCNQGTNSTKIKTRGVCPLLHKHLVMKDEYFFWKDVGEESTSQKFVA